MIGCAVVGCVSNGNIDVEGKYAPSSTYLCAPHAADSLWKKALDYDGITYEGGRAPTFVVFSETNPYIKEYEKVMLEVQRAKVSASPL